MQEKGMENLFRIGDVAKLFHVSVSSLRHYEQLGLLSPEYVDPETGYRYYSTRQFEVLNMLRYLRVLDMPLPEISEFLHNRDIDVIEEKLKQQKDAVIQKQLELKRIEKKIDNRLRQLQDAKNSELDVIRLVNAPECRLFWRQDSLTIRNFLDMEAPIQKLEQARNEAAAEATADSDPSDQPAVEPTIFFGKVGISISIENLNLGHFDRYDGIFLVLDPEDRFAGEPLVLPKTQCVTVRFCGSHAEAPIRYRQLLDYIHKQQLTITGFSREITIIDYGITNDTSKFVTEISIPVTAS